MMEKERTTKKSLLRALYLLPLVCISLALNAQTKVNYAYEDIQSNQTPRKIVGRVTYESDTLKYENVNPEKEITWDVDAHYLPEGKNVDELIKSLPGVEIDEDGTITVNGKPISRVLVNGEELNLNKTEQAEPASNTTKSIDDNGNIKIDTQNGTRVNLNGTQVTK